ncbi:MAG: hypothetical protein ACLPWS_18570 [Rhodomicrobium sp.]
MNGVIKAYDPKTGSGVIRMAGGLKFAFEKGDWHEIKLPAIGDRVDFQVNGKNATEVYLFPRKDRPAAARALDFGLIAGGFAIVFMSAIIVDVFFNILKLKPNDMVGLGIILYILVIISWVQGTNYKIVRGMATAYVLLATALALPIIINHLGS